MGGMNRTGGPRGGFRAAKTEIMRTPPAEQAAERVDSAPEKGVDSESNILQAGEKFLSQEKVARQVLELKAEAANSDLEQTKSAAERFADSPAIAQKIQALLEGKQQEAQAAGNRMKEKQAKREMEGLSAFMKHHESFKGQDIEAQKNEIVADLKAKKENPNYTQDPNIMAEVRALENKLDDMDDYISGKAAVERKMQLLDDEPGDQAASSAPQRLAA